MDAGQRHRATLSGAAENCSRGNPYRRSTSWVFPQATANACDDEESIQFWPLDTSRFPASSPSLAIRNYRRSVKACFRFVPAGSGSGVGRPHTASLRLSGGDFAAQPKIQVTRDRIETSSDEIRSDLDPHVINILIAQLSRESTYGPTRTCD